MILKDIISKYVKLEKHGKNFKGLCPFHKEKTPSFIVNITKDRFQCFGCGKEGDALRFIKEMLRIERDHFCIDAPDEETKRSIALQLLSMEAKISMERLKAGRLTGYEEEALRLGYEILKRLPIYMGEETRPTEYSSAGGMILVHNWELEEDLEG